jgi:hypothetical protein
MIIYDLRCENGHIFEGWFEDSQAYEDQNARCLVSCPVCGSHKNQVAPSSVMYVGKESHAFRNKTPEELSLKKACDL